MTEAALDAAWSAHPWWIVIGVGFASYGLAGDRGVWLVCGVFITLKAFGWFH